MGTKAELRAPSEKILRNVFGSRNSTKKMSASTPVPKKIAIKISLTYPSTLLIEVKNEYINDDLKTFIFLLFTLIFCSKSRQK